MDRKSVLKLGRRGGPSSVCGWPRAGRCIRLGCSGSPRRCGCCWRHTWRRRSSLSAWASPSGPRRPSPATCRTGTCTAASPSAAESSRSTRRVWRVCPGGARGARGQPPAPRAYPEVGWEGGGVGSRPGLQPRKPCLRRQILRIVGLCPSSFLKAWIPWDDSKKKPKAAALRRHVTPVK